MVERFLGVEEVVGSNPVAPTIIEKKDAWKTMRPFCWQLLCGVSNGLRFHAPEARKSCWGGWRAVLIIDKPFAVGSFDESNLLGR